FCTAEMAGCFARYRATHWASSWLIVGLPACGCATGCLAAPPLAARRFCARPAADFFETAVGWAPATAALAPLSFAALGSRTYTVRLCSPRDRTTLSESTSLSLKPLI